MRQLIVLAVCAACTREPGEGFPINPGGGGGIGSSSGRDAAVIEPDGAPPIAGRVCLVSDAHALSPCAPAGAGGLTVGLGTSSAVTADDGSFTLTPPANTTDLFWTVDGSAIVSSAREMTATAPTLPVLGTDLYDDMLLAINENASATNGGVMMRITRLGAPVADATVAAAGAVSQIYYDAEVVNEWDVDATSARGMVWIPSLTPGTDVTLTITANAVDTPVTTRVFADTLTFVFAEIP